jgi:hypothetical protein
MKRFGVTICAIVILSIAVNPLFAQSLEYGVKAGLNFATFGGEDAGDWGTRTGFSFGGFLAYPVADIFFIQPELLYTMKGAEVRYDFGLTSFDDSEEKYNVKNNVLMLMISLQL